MGSCVIILDTYYAQISMKIHCNMIQLIEWIHGTSNWIDFVAWKTTDICIFHCCVYTWVIPLAPEFSICMCSVNPSSDWNRGGGLLVCSLRYRSSFPPMYQSSLFPHYPQLMIYFHCIVFNFAQTCMTHGHQSSSPSIHVHGKILLGSVVDGISLSLARTSHLHLWPTTNDVCWCGVSTPQPWDHKGLFLTIWEYGETLG